MAKAQFGEYGAYDTPGGVRFQQNNKLVSEKAVPPEVVSYLKNQLNSQPQDAAQPAEPTPQARFPKPTEEELKAMREASKQVPPELALSPEEEAARAANPLPEPAPLNPADFEDTPEPTKDSPAAHYQEELAANGLLPDSPTNLAPPQTGLATPQPEHPTEQARRETTEEMSAYMETVSIYTASIKDIAQALYDRFGVYTIFLNTTPQTDEINPLTGEAFTRYHQGIAYQALVKARSSGYFSKPAELGMERMTEGRIAHENYQREAGDPRHAQTMTDHNVPATVAPANSFEYRTSPAAGQERQTHYIAHEPDPVTGEIRAVRKEIPQEAQHDGGHGVRQRYDPSTDEVIAEPRFGQQVIRPNW